MRFLIILIIIFYGFVSCKQNNVVEKSNTEDFSNTELKKSKKKNLINPEKWIIVQDLNLLEFNSLPFIFENYYENNFPERTYPYYLPKKDLKDYLIGKNYDGETFECYLVPNKNADLFIIIVSIFRGDSNYYNILTANSNKILNIKEVGAIGHSDSIITFDISKDYLINIYKGFNNNKTLTDKVKINDNGIFEKVQI